MYQWKDPNDDLDFTPKMNRADKEQAIHMAYYLDPPLPESLQALAETALDSGKLSDWVRFCMAAKEAGYEIH